MTQSAFLLRVRRAIRSQRQVSFLTSPGGMGSLVALQTSSVRHGRQAACATELPQSERGTIRRDVRGTYRARQMIVSPLQGLWEISDDTRGVAPGWFVVPFQGNGT